MMFAKRLREGVRRGEITCSVRFWLRPRVQVGRRYRMEEGEIEVDSITPIGFPDITPALARESDFLGLVDLLKIAKHGKGENIYLVRFHYVAPRRKGRNSATACATHHVTDRRFSAGKPSPWLDNPVRRETAAAFSTSRRMASIFTHSYIQMATETFELYSSRSCSTFLTNCGDAFRLCGISGQIMPARPGVSVPGRA